MQSPAKALFLVLCLAFSLLRAQDFEVNASKYLLGTLVEAKILTGEIEKGRTALYHAFREIERIEALLSSYKDSSEISGINRSSGISPVKVSFETYSILKRSVEYHSLSHGKFDVTIGAVSLLWGFSSETPRETPPSTAAIDSALKLTGINDLILNPADTTVFLARSGMKIDLGGVAKGYAIDRAAASLDSSGIKSFLINAGGDIFVRGEKPDGNKWVVGVKNAYPDEKLRHELIARFDLQNMSIATSGDYERYFDYMGRRYHHIIDPATGYPGEKVRSVSIIAETAEMADVLATWGFLDKEKISVSGTKYLICDYGNNLFYDSARLKSCNMILFDK